MTMPEAEQRKKFIAWQSDLSGKFSWNDNTRPRVVPMLQGTSESAVWQICQQGFGVVGTTDNGFYGAGVYFTSKLGYADKYAKSSPDGSRPFIVSMVIPGNSFPVVEHPFAADGSSANPSGFKGKVGRLGYQSHLTYVDRHRPNAPVKGLVDSAVADELVIFDSAQALPLFVFYCSDGVKSQAHSPPQKNALLTLFFSVQIDSTLAKALNVSLSPTAASIPAAFNSISEITYLSLESSNLSKFPNSLGKGRFSLLPTGLLQIFF